MTQLTATSLCLVQDIQNYVAHDTTYGSHSQTQCRYLQCYTHGPQSQNLNGSKSHTIRDTNVRQDIDTKILNIFTL